MTENWTKRGKRTGVVIGIAALALGFGVWVGAEAANGEGAGNLIDKDFQLAIRKHIERRFFNLIDASDSQRQSIDKLVAAQADQSYPMREKLREGLVQLNNMAAKDDVTDSQITDKVHELRALHEEIMDGRLSTMLKIRQQLSLDQRKAVADRINDLLSGGGKSSLMRRLQSSLPKGNLPSLL